MHKFKSRLIAAFILIAGGVLNTAPAMSNEAGDFIIRARGIHLTPNAHSNGILPDLASSYLDPQPAMVPEVDFTYMVTGNIGIELIAATSHHNFDGGGAAIGNLGTVAGTYLLPPTLLLQYHLNPFGRFKPYFGAGINYTITYGENADSSLENILGTTEIEANNSLGYALQMGVDIDIGNRWHVNVDLKYIDMSFDLELKSGTTTRTVITDVNPIVFGVGFGYRF